MERLTQPQYAFGPFVLDPVEKVLLRDGHPVSLAPKVFEILHALVEAHGHVLDKAALLKRVWPDTFVEEATLAQDIFTLRKVLGEAAEGREYIETVPKRGYRFVALVEEIEEVVEDPARVAVGKRPRGAASSSRSSLLGWAVPGLAILIGVAGYVAWRVATGQAASAPARIMLAVMPFENLTGDPQQDYFSEGLTEEMITRLGGLDPEQLGVIARTSAMHYKGTTQRASEIGRELGVDYLLEGSVRREGRRVRISAQLIRVRDETHLWAENYDRDVRDVLQLDSDVAGAIAREIEIKLSPQALARLASAHGIDPEAYEFFLKGRLFLNKRTGEGFQRSADLFQQAIAIDPNYVKAYAGLADSYILLAAFGVKSPADTIPKARAAALLAIEIDERSAEAHASMGFILSRFDWNWRDAEREFNRSLDLDPNYTTAHHWYALHLIGLGRSTEAIAEIRRAQQLDPASPLLATDAGLVLYSARQYGSAKKECEKALELDPTYGLAHRTLGLIDEEMGMHEKAIAEFHEALNLLGEDPWTLAQIGRSYARAGNQKQALQSMRELRQLSQRRYVSPLWLALLGVSLDPKSDEVFAWLEKAYESRINLSALVVDPAFDGIRQDPRFHSLLKRAGLPEMKLN